MKYAGVLDDGELVFFSDWETALQASKEMGFTFFFPRKDIFSTEKQKKAIMLENGEWKTVRLSELEGKCTCGCNL
jgi:hypothetical protein